MDAYEIRLQVLTMAKDMLMQNYENNFHNTLNKNEHIMRNCTEKFSNLDSILLDLPNLPTSKEILELSKQLYSFVENRPLKINDKK